MIPAALSLRRHHATMQVPTVVVAGAGDLLVNARWSSSALAGRLSQGWLRLVEGAGHMVHHTAPHQVMAAIHQAAALGCAERQRCVQGVTAEQPALAVGALGCESGGRGFRLGPKARRCGPGSRRIRRPAGAR